MAADNSVINAPRYFKLMKRGKKILNNIYAMYEQSWVETLCGKWDTVKLKYGRACMLEKKEKYYTELSNSITTFNKNNSSHLSNAKIQSAILKVVM